MFEFLDTVAVAHVAVDTDSMRELQAALTPTATGDMALLIDYDTLEECEEPAAQRLLNTLPEDFVGMVYVTR
jgi:hypothetical protein